MSQSEFPPELTQAAPGILGSLVALRWIQGSPLQRVISFIGGCAASRYGTGYLSEAMGTDRDLTAFLLGLFGMAIAAKIFEALAAFDLIGRLDKLLARWGL